MGDNQYKDALKQQRKAQRRAAREEWKATKKRSSGVLAGLLLLVVGCALLLKEFGIFHFPGWFFSWPMILIAFGLLAGIGNAFRDPGWMIITAVGAVFLLDKIWPEIPIHHFIWPVLIMLVGLIFIFAPRRHRKWHMRYGHDWRKDSLNKDWREYYEQHPHETPFTPKTPETPLQPQEPAFTDNDRDRNLGNWLDVTSIFGSIKKTVYSKQFRGGDIVSLFGGAEVNLMQADFEGTIVIEMVQIFGGAKLIIPPHWQVQPNMTAVFGGIDDKRPPQANYDSTKKVILNGTTFFGGIEIRSY